jgi:hypothetical protein
VTRSERRNSARTGTLWVGVKQLQLIRWRSTSLRLEGVRRSLRPSVVRSVSGNQIQVGTHRSLPNSERQDRHSFRKYAVDVDAIMLLHIYLRPERKCKTSGSGVFPHRKIHRMFRTDKMSCYTTLTEWRLREKTEKTPMSEKDKLAAEAIDRWEDFQEGLASCATTPRSRISRSSEWPPGMSTSTLFADADHVPAGVIGPADVSPGLRLGREERQLDAVHCIPRIEEVVD